MKNLNRELRSLRLVDPKVVDNCSLKVYCELKRLLRDILWVQSGFIIFYPLLNNTLKDIRGN